MGSPLVWITKRKVKKGVRYLVRWMEPESGRNPAKTFQRLEDAREFYAQLFRDLKNKEYHAPVKINYDDWVKLHLAELNNSQEIELATKTIAGQKEALNALGEACKPKRPEDVNPRMIREFRRIQLDRGLAPRTINKYISAIRSALSYAVRAEIIPSNKLLGPHRLFLREARKPPRILEVGEVRALLNVATDTRHKAVISLAYYHGLRRGEICWLRWQDIDFEHFRLDVVDRPGAHTKTRSSRSVALRGETAELLKRLSLKSKTEYVFENPSRYFHTIDKWFKKLVKSAQLDHCTLHDLRKTCNTLMKEAGVPLEAAMQVLGHSSVMVNQRHYTGVLTEQQKRAINSIPSAG